MTASFVRVLSLSSLVLAACATDPQPPQALPEPTPAAIDYAHHLETCDPTLTSQLEAVTSGQSTLEPTPSAKCEVGESLAAEGGCGFVAWWNWAGFSDRAACVALGLPLCYATICVASWLS